MVAWPGLAVEVAFSGNPNDVSPTWTNITSYVQGFTTKRGRQTELDVFQPGVCEIKLDNQDRRFDPTHTAGPYYPNVIIGKRIRISATYSSTTYRIFDGYIDGWPQTWVARVAASVPVHATDAFKRFQLFPLNGTYASVPAGNVPWAFWQFQGNINDSSGNGNNGTWVGSNAATYGGAGPGFTVGAQSKYFHSDSEMTHGTTGWATGSGFTLELVQYQSGWAGNDGVAHGIWQTHAPVWAGTTNGITIMKWSSNQLYFRVVSPTAVLYDLAPAVDATSMPSTTFIHWAFTASNADGMRIYRNGVLFAGPANAGMVLPTAAPAAPRVGRGHDAFATAYFQYFAIYSQALAADQIYDRYRAAAANFPASQTSATRIGAVLDIMGWPSARRDLDGGAAILAASAPQESMLSYLQRINNTEVGRLFMGGNGDVRFIGRDAAVSPPYTTVQAVFGDDAAGAELPYSDLILNYDDAQTWNEVRLQRVGGTLQVARDATLQTTDLVRTFSDTTLLHFSDAQTLSAAQYRLEQYKQPRLRIEQLGIQAARSPAALWPQALGRDIGDRVQVIRRPQGIGAPVSEQCIIEGIAHDFDPTSMWRTTYNLSRADITAYWILGTVGRSELDSTTRLSF